MADKKLDEHLKLFANWTNTLATAILTAGVFTPLALYIYGIGPEARNEYLLSGLIFVCIAGALILHLRGQVVLAFMDNGDDADA